MCTESKKEKHIKFCKTHTPSNHVRITQKADENGKIKQKKKWCFPVGVLFDNKIMAIADDIFSSISEILLNNSTNI